MIEGKIAGFGAINLDLIFTVDDFSLIEAEGIRIEPGTEISSSERAFERLHEQLIRVGTLRSRCGGGSAANTMVALARMGFPTTFIGKVGDDEEGDFLVQQMSPVDTGLIRRGGRSGMCLVIIDRIGDRFILVLGNANDTLSIDEIDIASLKKVSWLHLSSFGGQAPFEAQRALLECLGHSLKVSLDPGEIYAAMGMDVLSPLISHSHVLFLTEREIRLLTGLDIISGTRDLLERGPSIVVCKRGNKGSSVFTREESLEVEALHVEKVIDNTGAGDVYNAGFLAGLFLGTPLSDCARFANVVAANSLRGYGREQYPTYQDLARFFLE